jgi:hypothetical protein
MIYVKLFSFNPPFQVHVDGIEFVNDQALLKLLRKLNFLVEIMFSIVLLHRIGRAPTSP